MTTGSRPSAPDFAPLVNDLAVMEYGQSYLIYATRPVTPYLAVPGPQVAITSATAETPGALEVAAAAAPADLLSPALASQIGLAPAVYYGTIALGGTAPVTSTTSSDGQPGIAVVARIGDVECGRAEILPGDDGALRYVLRVPSAAQSAGCGEPGKRVDFVLNGGVAASENWGNNRALRVDLPAMP